MKHPKVIIKSLPKSWWAIYTEALCNSRGMKTENQQWWDRTLLMVELKREVERSWKPIYSEASPDTTGFLSESV